MRRPSAIALVAVIVALTGGSAHSAGPCSLADATGDAQPWAAVLGMPVLSLETDAPGAGGRGDLTTLALRADGLDLVATLGAHDLSAPRTQRSIATEYSVSFSIDGQPTTIVAAEQDGAWAYYAASDEILGVGPRTPYAGPAVEGAVDLEANLITMTVPDFFAGRALLLTDIIGKAVEGVMTPTREAAGWSPLVYGYTWDRIGGSPGGSQLPPSMDLSACA